MNDDRQRLALNGYSPFSHGDSIEKEKLLFHENIDSFLNLNIHSPQIIFCTDDNQSTGIFNDLLMMSQKGHSTLFLLSDSLYCMKLIKKYPDATFKSYKFGQKYTEERFEKALQNINATHYIKFRKCDENNDVDLGPLFSKCALPFYQAFNISTSSSIIDISGSLYIPSKTCKPSIIEIRNLN